MRMLKLLTLALIASNVATALPQRGRFAMMKVAADQGWVQTVALRLDGIDDYIDTLTNGGAAIQVRTLARYVSFTNSDKLFGISTPPFYGIGIRTGTPNEFYALAGNTTVTIDDYIESFVFVRYDPQNTVASVDSTSVAILPNVSAGSLWIGANSVGIQFSNVEVARFQIIDDGVLVADLQANADGTFHDVVRGGTYGNGGSGSLTVVDISGETFPDQDWK